MNKGKFSISKRLSNSFIEKKNSNISGYGLFGSINFNPGDIVCSYGGKIISMSDFDSLVD